MTVTASSRISARAVVILLSVTAVAADKAYPIFTADNFVTTMKTAGKNVAALNASLAKNDFETAKTQLARSREQLAITVQFWRDKKKDDAIRMLRDALMKMDSLDTALSAEKIDTVETGAIAKQIGAACQACHAVYREQDPATKAYRVKTESAP